MGLANRLYNFVARRTVKSAEVNAEINQILGILNGGIENSNVRMNAGIRQDQGKLILDYATIRTNLAAEPGTLNGSVITDLTVPLEKLVYAENTLVGVGVYANTTPATFPWVIPAGTFKHFMVVMYGAVVEITGDDTAPERKIQITANGNTMVAAQLGRLTQRISEPADSFLSKLSGMAMCYIQMTAATNDYVSAIPKLIISQSHSFNITEASAAPLTQKQIQIFGR